MEIALSGASASGAIRIRWRSMISRASASDYFCVKDKKHHEVGLPGQKRRCWQCGARMIEKKCVNVVVKNGKE